MLHVWHVQQLAVVSCVKLVAFGALSRRHHAPHTLTIQQPHHCIQTTATNRASSLSFCAAITVVAWSSYVQVENKILEKFGAKSVGCREAFRRSTTPIFLASVILFGISVTSFVTAFVLIGYIKPCTQPPTPNPNPPNPTPYTPKGIQTSDIVQIDVIKPYLLPKGTPAGTTGPVNRLANRTLWFTHIYTHTYAHTRTRTHARVHTRAH